MKRIIIAASLLGFATAPALAQQFYVVQDSNTKRCTVVSQKPTTTTTTIVGDGAVYTTQEEANAAMAKVKVCTR